MRILPSREKESWGVFARSGQYISLSPRKKEVLILSGQSGVPLSFSGEKKRGGCFWLGEEERGVILGAIASALRIIGPLGEEEASLTANFGLFGNWTLAEKRGKGS